MNSPDDGDKQIWATVPVLPQHRFDQQALQRYLAAHLAPGGDAATPTAPLRVRQFQGGQSNPTFLLRWGAACFVLRKKPPGPLLPKAHLVEREYRVMKALWSSPVPVPRMRLLCEDPDIIGTPFFVMDFAPGRICAEPTLAAVAPAQRRALLDELTIGLAALHRVDWRACGLVGFGRPENFVARQIAVWSRQYQAAQTTALPEMARLTAWLEARLPANPANSIVHGDYRVGNVILHASEPKVLALLDWELSTLGDPLADLGYFLMPYYLRADIPGLKGLKGLDLDALGLPGKDELLATYCRASGRPAVGDLDYYVVLSLFRLTAILQGVYARALQGNAAHADALQVGKRAALLAQTGWAIAQRRDG
jgi:aminoglycoside phosphotransferase (APT) family kinase protein